jgi:hypothetical protein
LTIRTALFRDTQRTPDALERYSAAIQELQKEPPLDRAIHVCEFAGFLDADGRIVGCMLHPSAPGNCGIDLRGLCYYGSLACTSFFCPAWDQIPPEYKAILVELLEDWHIYGLVASDAGFAVSLFRALEDSVGEAVDQDRLFSGPAPVILREMLAWKDSWPFRGVSTKRQSQYYSKAPRKDDKQDSIRILLASLDFTFGMDARAPGADEFVRHRMEDFARVY